MAYRLLLLAIMNKHFSRTKILWIQIAFWTFYFLINLMDIRQSDGWALSIREALLDACSLMIGVYIHVLWLIPKFLYKKRFYAYGVYMFGLSALMVIIWVFFYYGLGMAQYEKTGSDCSECYMNWLFILISVFHSLLVIVGLSSAWVVYDRFKAREELKEVEKNQIETQLNALKAQINPHFLFNVLNSAHFLIPKKPETASMVLGKLSEILQYQLYRTSQGKVYLQDELLQLKNYIDLEKIRQGEALTIEDNLQFVRENIPIEPFMFLPLVENAFKHSRSIQQSHIVINCCMSDKQLTFSIENTVPGEQTPTEGGIGIPNLKKRLELLYPDAHEYHYGLDNEKYKAQLTLNL